MKQIVIATLFSVMLCSFSFATETLELKDENEKLNYTLGYQIGENLKQQGVSVNSEVLMKGIQDGLSGAQLLMTQKDMRESLLEFKKQSLAAKRVQKQKMAEQYRGEGREFLAANAGKPGVVTLPSGLQYKVISEGTGKKPGPQDSVTVHYRGKLLDGREFDSSYRKGEPATFRVDGVIKGWTEALQLMKEGAHWQLFIPADLAYGERGPLADKTLIFDVELISIQ